MRTRPPWLTNSVALALTAATTATAATATPDDNNLERRRTPVVEVFEQARDAVVSITSTEIITVRSGSRFDGLFEDLFDMPRRRGATRQHRRESVGSGLVIHPDGYIVTNAHVVARTTARSVQFADGRSYDAEIVAADTRRDLAVLKITDDGPLPTIPLGRSDDLMVGETVIAIGNPLGFQHTVTAGVVSAVGRDLEMSRDMTFTGLIQTDASINPGNSGGPLLNVLGELIGINSAIRGDAQNIGFAIPVDQLREVLPDMLDVERRYGIVSGLEIDHLTTPRVLGVLGDSAADAAGVRPGDVIVGIDGKTLREGIDFDIALIKRRPGELVRLEIDRDGERIETTLRLKPRPAPDGGALARDRLGLELYPLPEPVAQELGLPPGRGLLVTDVEPLGPASEAGLRPRDVLIALGRHYVSSLTALGQRLETVPEGDVVPIRILRVERSRKLQLEGPIRVR